MVKLPSDDDDDDNDNNGDDDDDDATDKVSHLCPVNHYVYIRATTDKPRLK